MPENKLTPEQQQAAQDAFHLQLGRAVAAWSFVESGLAIFFQRLTQIPPVTAHKIFYSGVGFEARARMLLSTKGWVKISPDILEHLNKIVEKAIHYSGSRNMIMHGDISFVGNEGSKYFGKYIILQDRQHRAADLPDTEVITLENLKLAAENFGKLAACIAVGLNEDEKDADQSPIKYLALIEKLPTEAHLEKLDPSIEAQFPIMPEDVPHLWR